MQLVRLEEHARLLVIQHLGVPLQRIGTKGEEFALVREEDRRGSLLVIRVIAGVEHFNPGFRTRLEQAWCNTISASNQEVVRLIRIC